MVDFEVHGEPMFSYELTEVNKSSSRENYVLTIAKMGAAFDELGHPTCIFAGIYTLASTNHIFCLNARRTIPIGTIPTTWWGVYMSMVASYSIVDCGAVADFNSWFRFKYHEYATRSVFRRDLAATGTLPRQCLEEPCIDLCRVGSRDI